MRSTAAYAGDRRRLHHLIHGDLDVSIEREVKAEVPTETAVEKVQETEAVANEEMSQDDAFLESQILTSAINSSILQEVGEDEIPPIEEIQESESQSAEGQRVRDFDEENPHSFSDWIKHYRGESDQDEERGLNRDNSALKAISDQAKQIQEKAEFFSASKMAKLSVVEDDDLITETLAKVYEAQGKFERAIQAYQKLQLKYPEKRVYFAGRIKAVEEKLNS